jgi:hypothetical protein
MDGRRVGAVLMAFVGLVWIGQGLGVLRGSSFMVDDLRWAAAGAALLLFAGILIVADRRPRS